MEDLETRHKLLRGAEELFMRYGVRSITMDEIARHLSISKKTLYQYFADKNDIVASVTMCFPASTRTCWIRGRAVESSTC